MADQYQTDRMVAAFKRANPERSEIEIRDLLNSWGVRILRADYEGRSGANRYRKINARDVRYAAVASGFACSWEIGNG